MSWAAPISVGPRFLRSTPDPAARRKACHSATALFREKLHGLRGALHEEVTIFALADAERGELAERIESLAQFIEGKLAAP